MFCPKCGNKIGEGARFCGKCGNPVPESPGGQTGAGETIRQEKKSGGKTLQPGKKQPVTAGIAVAVIVTAVVLLLVFTGVLGGPSIREQWGADYPELVKLLEDQGITRMNEVKNVKELNLENDILGNDLSILAEFQNLEKVNLSSSSAGDFSVLLTLPKLRDLDIRYCGGISDEVLYEMTQLEGLGISTECEDLNDLALVFELPNLKKLRLGGYRMTDISALVRLPELEEFALEGGSVRDISVLSSLKNLKDLQLRRCGEIENLRIVSELESLEKLDISYTQITDIRFLASLENLESLCLEGCWNIENIDVLSELENLKELSFQAGEVRSLQPLEDLKKMEILTIEDIADLSNLRILAQMKNLSSLTLGTSDELNNGEKIEIDWAVLSELKNITKLHLDFDGGTVETFEGLSGLSGLEHLALGHGYLGDMGCIAGLKNLKSMTLAN